MNPAHRNSRIIARHQVQGVILALVTISTIALAATLGTGHLGSRLGPSNSQEAPPPHRPGPTTAERKLASAQAHMLAARVRESVMIERGSSQEDRQAWEHSLASAIRALRSLEHSPDARMLSGQILEAVTHLQHYAQHVDQALLATHKAARPEAEDIPTRASLRLEAAYQATEIMTSMLSNPRTASTTSLAQAERR